MAAACAFFLGPNWTRERSAAPPPSAASPLSTHNLSGYIYSFHMLRRLGSATVVPRIVRQFARPISITPELPHVDVLQPSVDFWKDEIDRKGGNWAPIPGRPRKNPYSVRNIYCIGRVRFRPDSSKTTRGRRSPDSFVFATHLTELR